MVEVKLITSAALHPIPKPVAKKLVQCCVDIAPPSHNPNWRKAWYGPEGKNYRLGFIHSKCHKQAIVEIDGQPYCRIHGGDVALGLLLKEYGDA